MIAADLDARQLGQHQVEQDEVRALGAERVQRLAAVGRRDDPEPVRLERLDERLAQGGLVVHDEDRACHLRQSIAARVNDALARVKGGPTVGASRDGRGGRAATTDRPRRTPHHHDHETARIIPMARIVKSTFMTQPSRLLSRVRRPFGSSTKYSTNSVQRPVVVEAQRPDVVVERPERAVRRRQVAALADRRRRGRHRSANGS